MKMSSLLRAAICCLVCSSAVAGCQPSSEQLAPVKGRVLYRGNPLPGGTIVFVPDVSHGTRGNLAIADILPDGSFALKTNDVLGAVCGHHRVTISWVQPQVLGATSQAALPVKYRDPQLSGLTREVLANTTNTFDIELQ